MPARKMPFFVSRSMARACPYATVPTIRADQARSKKHPRAGRAHTVIFRGRCAITQSWNHVRLLAHSSHNHGMRYNHSLAYISRSRVASVTQCDKGAAQNGQLVVSERSGDGMLPVVLLTRFSLSSESFRQLASLVPAGDRKTSRRTSTASASRDNWNRRRSGATAAKRAADDRLV